MNTYRVFLTGSGIAPAARALLEEQRCVVEVGAADDSPEVLAAKLERFDPDGVIVRQGQITASVQRAAKHLKVICKHGVGTDNIDIEAASRRGIPVLFTPGANSEVAAQHALALLLSLVRHIPAQDRGVRDGDFDKAGYQGKEINGQTLGLIGFGRIGRRLSELVAPMNIRVLAYYPSQETKDLPDHVSRASSVERVFEAADFISLHCPLTERTRGLINRDTIAAMKDGVLLVNTARGALIAQDDLVEALETGKVGGAALDVFEHEPIPGDHPLLGLENVVLTMHVAGMSDQSFTNVGLQAVRNVLSVLGGERVDLGSVANPETLAPQSCR